eukprot:1310302-Heterocapsa_arctica.AAC.1
MALARGLPDGPVHPKMLIFDFDLDFDFDSSTLASRKPTSISFSSSRNSFMSISALLSRSKSEKRRGIS